MDGSTMVEPYTTHHLGSYASSRHGDLRPSHLPMPFSRPGYVPVGRSPLPSPGFHSSPLGNPWPSHPTVQAPAAREYSNPQSPPYRREESNKPSLPSLKSLLNETRTSPSATPQVSSATLQPLPREPNYDQATYKPPALYPNKRTRTDSGWYGQGADRNAHESTTLPHISTRPEDVTKPRQYDVPLSASASPPSYQYQHSDDGRSRMSNHTSPEIQSRGAQRQPGLLPRPDSVKGFQTEGDRTLLYEPLSATQSRSSSAQLQDEASYRASPYNDRGAAERYPVEPQRQAYPPVSSFAKDYPPTNHEGHGGPTYPYSPAFFVPSHYEYQNGKSRKRSNLPKQSTEIMKRWFDENMQNPYPSEEQKRHFAAVAGINLTQVSNWFINHRRRCPELREKRDKGRDGSRDDDL